MGEKTKLKSIGLKKRTPKRRLDSRFWNGLLIGAISLIAIGYIFGGYLGMLGYLMIYAGLFASAYRFIYKYFILKSFLSKTYSPCPYCDKSVLVNEDWQCDFCDRYQDEPRFLSQPCIHCGREIKSFFCEHCHKEILV